MPALDVLEVNLSFFAAILSTILGAGVAFIIFCCAVVSMLSINLSNAYTGGYSLINRLPQIGMVKSAILFGVVATILCTLPTPVGEVKQFISFLGALVITLSAIIISDFLFVKKLELKLADLDRLVDNSFRYNKKALFCIVSGMMMNVSSYTKRLVTRLYRLFINNIKKADLLLDKKVCFHVLFTKINIMINALNIF